MNDDAADLDATALAALVRTKQVHPRELVEHAIARIEALNPALNAVVTKLYDSARDAAGGTLPDGPFTGVPFLVKDLLATMAGVPQTSGSGFTRGYVAAHDSELVARYRRAGLVIVGRTNTPEFGLPPTTEPRLFGPTRNPWDTTRSAGGSSGGSAAAVASRMVPMAHGNDGGGSIRIPASCCGIFGLKPTRGRNPMGPDVGDVMHGLVVEHALTVSVRDSAALLDATEGMDVGAPYAAPGKARPYAQEVGITPGRLRVAVSTATPMGTAVHPDCLAAVEDTAKLLADLGHTVEHRDLAMADPGAMYQAFLALWAGGTVATVDGWAHALGKTPREEDFEPLTWALYESARSVPLSRYLLGVAYLQGVSREIQRQFVDVDVWLTPTLAQPPFALGALDPQPGDPLAGFFRGAEYVPYTPVYNVTGQPAMSVPLGWSPRGLPLGSHFVGRFGDEATLFRLAAQLEQARPWAHRRPPVSVGGTVGGPAAVV